MEKPLKMPEGPNPFIMGSKADIMRQEEEHRKLLRDLEAEIPFIQEARFTRVYLPHMANPNIPFPYAAWVNEVSKHAANPVNIIGQDGTIVGQVPPLCDTEGMHSTEYSREQSLCFVASDVGDIANRTPHIAQQVFYGLMTGRIPKGKLNLKMARAWNELFLKYGYQNPHAIKAAELKNTTDTHTVDEPTSGIYDEGELL